MHNIFSKSIKNKFYGLTYMGIAACSAMILVSSVQAHPSGEHDPEEDAPIFEGTTFAPIQGGKGHGMKVKLEVIVDEDQGITSPLKGVPSPGDSKHLMYVIDQVGKLWLIDLSTTNSATEVVDFASEVDLVDVGTPFLPASPFDERGLLGFAFHPDYLDSGEDGYKKFYTYTSEDIDGSPTFPTTMPALTDPDHQAVISEWTVDDPTDDVFTIDGTRNVMMRIDEPQFNHDGGDILFKDGDLYISLGDGGAADDVATGHTASGNAQDNTNPLGTILRVVPDPAGGSPYYTIPLSGNLDDDSSDDDIVDEIFAYGFRNPYRMSVDPQTGDLYVADVGQNDIEELNIVNAPGNYGWRLKEGTAFFTPTDMDEPGHSTVEDICGMACDGLIDPIAQYDTHGEGHAIIGGFMYRGSAIPKLKNRYVFGDFSGYEFNFVPQVEDEPLFNNYGRLFVLNKNPSGNGLHKVKNLNFDYRLGPVNNPNLADHDHTLAILGFGIDKDGEIYVLGNLSGTPDSTIQEGVVLKLSPNP